MTLDQTISNFLRDGQYRIAQLSVEMDEIQDNGSYLYKVALKRRRMISALMDNLFVGIWPIADNGYNYLQFVQGTQKALYTWTDNEVLAEMEYVRYYTRMSEVPYITFTAHYPQIANTSINGGTSSGNGLPSGLYGQIIMYNVINLPIAVDIDPWVGPFEDESINSYFSNRL